MEEKPPYLSLAVLCYRAEEGIVPFVVQLHAILSDYNFPWELVLVANYSKGKPDRTPEIVKDLCRRLPHTRFIAEEKRGMMGWDMIKGLDACRGTYIGVVDGDGQFPHEAINACVGLLLHEDLDLVKTYRVRRGDGPVRFVVSTVFNLIFRALFPKSRYFDINSKPKLFKRTSYEKLRLEDPSWFIDAEIMIKAGELGFKVAEIPIHFVELKGRYSFVRPGAVMEFFRGMFRYRFGAKKGSWRT